MLLCTKLVVEGKNAFPALVNDEGLHLQESRECMNIPARMEATLPA